MKDLGIKYFYEEHPIIQIASDVDPSSLCGFCSRMKRGILHTVAVREGYNVLALGQHFDDLAESWLMYAFHNGQLDTIKATNTLKFGSHCSTN
jgi:tRNA(Ile)-lysidine synthase TilS/MesJ